MTMQPAAATR
jgi:hypothetical protein